MDLKGADRLEGNAAPACLESTGTHVVVARNHGGGEQKGVFQRNTAHLGPETVFVLRHGDFQLRLHLVMQAGHERRDGDLAGADTGLLTRCRAADAGVHRRETGCRRLFIGKPDAAQKRRAVDLSAGGAAGRSGTECTADHIRAVQFLFEHMIPPSITLRPGDRPLQLVLLTVVRLLPVAGRKIDKIADRASGEVVCKVFVGDLEHAFVD